jgi:hypothetical protein
MWESDDNSRGGIKMRGMQRTTDHIAPLIVVFIRGRSWPLYWFEGTPIEDVIGPGQGPVLPSPSTGAEIQSSTADPP